MSRRDDKIVLFILNIIWGILKYTVFFLWFGTKAIWDYGTQLIYIERKKNIGIIVRIFAGIPIATVILFCMIVYSYRQEMQQQGIKALWCIVTRGRCITSEIRHEMRTEMLHSLTGATQ